MLFNRAWCVCVLLLAALMGGCQMLGCVREGTMIATPSGERAVESLRQGDEVWSIDARGDRVLGQITAVSKGRGFQFLRLSAAGRSLDVTPTHLIFAHSTWVRASDLGEAHELRSLSGAMPIESISRLHESDTVYDLSVWPCENYFANGMLVHNKTIAPPPTKEETIGPWGFFGPGGAYYQLELREQGTGHWTAWSAPRNGLPTADTQSSGGEIAWGFVDRYTIQIDALVHRNNIPSAAWRYRGVVGGDGIAEFDGREKTPLHLARPEVMARLIGLGGVPEAPPVTPPTPERRIRGDTSWQPKAPFLRPRQ